MKLIPTASQTVGPFFSIGLEPLHQDPAEMGSATAITISGRVVDGGGQPVPDCVLEFWTSKLFARVPTSVDGQYSVLVEAGVNRLEVLLFMRGLLKPVYTRLYLGSTSKTTDDVVSKEIPEHRLSTLLAQPGTAPNQFVWNVKMQGNDETVFFDY